MDTIVQPIVRFGDFEVDTRSGELRKSGRKIRLPEQSFQILELLLDRAGEVVTREELRKRLWPAGTFVDFDAGLNNAVRKLRDALADPAESPRYIETLPRRGYRFIAPVEAPPFAALETTAARVPARRPGFRHRLSGAPVAALAAVLVALALSGTRERWRGRSAPVTIGSLAVLPFENLTGEDGQDYFVDGMTDALITNLAQVRALRVISRTSVMQYKRANKSLPRIAEELDVDAVVEGTVARSGDRVRVTAQLIHAPTDRHLWARSYEHELRDVLALQGELAGEGAEREFQLSLALEPNYAEGHRAYAIYLLTVRRHEEAIAEARRARELSPLSLVINTELGTALVRAGRYDEAIERLQKTLEIDPKFARAYATLAGAYDRQGDRPRAVAVLEKAVSLSGGTPHPWLGYAYGVTGRRREALEILARLAKLSREHYVSPQDFAVVQLGLGDKDQAMAWLERAYEERAFEVLAFSGELFDRLSDDPRFQDLRRRMRLPAGRGD
jgi:TolB-like protein/DNA-binding winged helix-turn-helix (wHTH) protein